MISIITVVFNGEKTIRKTIESVCTQTILPLEYIIIDGLSTDSTMDIVNEFSKKYSFIKHISEKDAGIYDAMNKGIKIASGNLIGMINSDDWYEQTAIEKMRNAYELHGSGVYYGLLKKILNEKEISLERLSHEFLEQNMIPHPSTFVSADIYKKHGLFDLDYKYSSDLDFIIRLAKKKVAFYRLDNVIANYSIGGASSSYNAAIEALWIRKSYNLLSNKKFFFKLCKLKIASILKY